MRQKTERNCAVAVNAKSTPGASSPVVRVRHAGRSAMNPRAPKGALHYDPRGVAYIVDLVGTSGEHGAPRKIRWIVTAPKPLNGWELGSRVAVCMVSRYDLIVKGIADFGASVFEGSIPNVRLPRWIVE